MNHVRIQYPIDVRGIGWQLNIFFSQRCHVSFENIPEHRGRILHLANLNESSTHAIKVRGIEWRFKQVFLLSSPLLFRVLFFR